jgi:hypothetical protein
MEVRDDRVIIDLFGGGPDQLKLLPEVMGGFFNAAVSICLTALHNDWIVEVRHEDDNTVKRIMFDKEQQ